jgi:hypothetical protein
MSTCLLFVVLLFALSLGARSGDLFEDDLDAAVWVTGDEGGWDRFEISKNNSSNSSLTLDQLVWAAPVTNTTVEVDDIIGLAFERERTDLTEKLDAFLDRFFGPFNQTSDTWTFVSFITIVPLRCSEVHKVVDLFDAAMQEANPGAQISSVAQRLGASACSGEGICPCTDARRKAQYTTRVMEVRSTSRSRDVVYPANFPFRVETR